MKSGRYATVRMSSSRSTDKHRHDRKQCIGGHDQACKQKNLLKRRVAISQRPLPALRYLSLPLAMSLPMIQRVAGLSAAQILMEKLSEMRAVGRRL